MRISDWSSDVCSSDLDISRLRRRKYFQPGIIGRIIQWVFRVKCISRLSGRIVKLTISIVISDKQRPSEKPRLAGLIHLIVAPREIGRASGRERVVQDV